jgi:hypothetical protein
MVAQAVQGLSSKDRPLRLGSVRLLSAVGPRVAETLPAIKRLHGDSWLDQELRRETARCLSLVAGFNQKGKLIYPLPKEDRDE